MAPEIIIAKILEWLTFEIIGENLFPKLKKPIKGDEFQRLGTQVLYKTIKENPEYKRILNFLREKGDFEVEDATELNKDKICKIFFEKDRKLCHDFLETLKMNYIEKINEVADENPVEKFQMEKIQEHDESIAELKKHVNEIVVSDTEVICYQDIVEKTLTTEYKEQLNHSWNLIENYKPIEALEILKGLKKRIWSNAESIVKYEILRNLGAAKFSLHHEQEAGKLFLEALQYNSSDEKALCNAAFGYLLLGQLEEAKTYANKVTAKNPANTKAYSIIIQTSSEDETLEDIVSKVPEPYRCDPEVAYVISHLARKRKNLTESRKWLEIAIENDKNDWPDPKGSLGERLLELIMKDRSTIYGIQISDEKKSQINRAIELLTHAWDRIADTDLRNLRSTWIANRGIAKRFLGNIRGAIKDIDTALDIHLDPVFIRYRALLASDNGDNEEAIQLLKNIQHAEETPEAPLLLAIVLRKEKKFKEAIEVINKFLGSNPPESTEKRANRILIQLYVDNENFENARIISDSMRASDPENIIDLVIAAYICRMSGKNTEALSFLNEAKTHITDSSPFDDLIELADEFYYLEQFEEAANIYERIVDTALDTPLTRRILNSYYQAGEIGKALEICQSLSQKFGPLEFVSEMEAAIYEEIGDLPEAKRVCKEYLEVYRDDFGVKLRLALLNLRSNNFGELDEFSKSQIDINNLSLDHGVKLAFLYTARNRNRKALEIMYEMRRKYFNNNETHLNFLFSFLQIKNENEEWLNPINVCIDTVVYIEDSSGKTEIYIIVDREDADIHRREFNKDHQIAQKLLGKSVGDDVLLKVSKYSKEIGKIVEIKSKYVQAFQEIQNSYEKQFPDRPGLWQMKLEPPEKEGGLSKNLELMIRETTEEQFEKCQIIEQFYREGKITLGIFANHAGRNVVDVWSRLMYNSDLGVRCCSGTSKEREYALSLLYDGPKLIVDVISLMTLHGLETGDTIVKEFGKLGIAQSTIDLLRNIIQERKGLPSRGYMTVGVEGDNLVKQVVSSGEVERNIEYMEGVLQWIKDNCEILPCKEALKIRRDKREELENSLGKSFFDTILIAGEPENMLYSDDALLRYFAKNDEHIRQLFGGTEFNVDGVWTQAVLMHCLNNSFLDRDSYSKMIVRLVCSHYYFTSIDADVLIEAARQSNWIPIEPFKTVSGILSRKNCDESSIMNLVLNFFFKLWKQQIPVALRNYLVLSLLDNITDGKNQDEILDRLVFLVRKRFSILPLSKRIISLVKLWKKLSEQVLKETI
ncbi:MAG: hypothetical protein PVF58_07760 [Candidatus Methanofastidiosia archaeon]|jgi:tetratricopeptide (TPR) repeat protein